MARKKILHVIRPAAGGMKNHLVSLIKHTSRDLFEPMAACPPGEMADELSGLGIKVYTVPLTGELSPVNDLKAVLTIRDLLVQNKIPIMHAHSSKAGLVGRLAARLAGTPAVFFTAHNSIFYENWPEWKKTVFAAAERLLAYNTRHIIAVSGALRNELLEREKIDRQKVVTIYNGIDPTPYNVGPDREETLRALGLEGGRVVGTVARLAPQKGVLYFIRAVAGLSELQGVSFVVVGDGPLRAELEAEAVNLGLKGKVVFLGYRRDVDKILNCLDILVLPSLTEGLPLIILEAMAAARPVVATTVGGIPEAVLDGVNGFLVQPGDADALAFAIRKMLENRIMAESMGEAGRRRVLEMFSLEEMVKKTERLYLEAFNGRDVTEVIDA